jgi:hypothetical protein
MKKLTLMAVIAVAGALGLSARATTISNVDLVTVQATVTLPNDPTETSKSVKFTVTKVKVVTKDVLGLIDDEFGTTFANTNGTQLAVDSFADGEVEVLDKNGNILNGDASEDGDDYDLGIDFNTSDDNSVATGSETDSKSTATWTTSSEFFYDSADDESFFDVDGLTSVTQTFDDTKEITSESFDISGFGNAEINDNEGIITGAEVKGSGKNNDNVDELTDLFE